MERKRFTEAEARAKVGKRIRTRVEFSGVPKGTTGRVVVADAMREGFDVAIEWELPSRPFGTQRRRLRDWFDKFEFEKHLEEI
jgi:hypothetical protein